MPRGGKRAGAGRKESPITRRSREFTLRMAERAIEQSKSGMSMLDIMIANARYFYAQALDAEAALAQLQPDALQDLTPQQQWEHALAEVKHAAGLREMAGAAATQAARYLHAPIGAVSGMTSQSRQPIIPLVERLKAYAQEELTLDSLEEADDRNR